MAWLQHNYLKQYCLIWETCGGVAWERCAYVNIKPFCLTETDQVGRVSNLMMIMMTMMNDNDDYGDSDDYNDNGCNNNNALGVKKILTHIYI